MPSKAILLPLVFLVSLATWPAVSARPAPKMPNVVFILIDDLGWNDVGCYGSTFHETPHIDRLASSGMRFTNAYAASPVCSPTRSSILSGKNPARTRITNFLKGRRQPKNSPILSAEYADQLDVEETTVAEVLKGAGYRTCFIGKWHLYSRHRFEDGKYLPERQGFDINIGGFHSGMPRSFFWPQWKGNPPIEGLEDGEYLPDRLSAEAVKFIDANRDRRFFLYLSHYTVHIPIQAKSEKIEKYRSKLKEHPRAQDEQRNPVYAAMVESMDDSVGRVLDALDRNGLTEKTIVIFFSDNGGLVTPEGRNTPATTLKPLRRGKGYLYEGGIREPCLVRWPGVTRAGSVCDHPVLSDDFLPTIVDMVGLDMTKVKTRGPIDGISFVPLLKDPGASLPRQALYWHYPHFSNQGGRPGGAVRVGDFKLIERFETGDLELYNLKDDLGETKNLAAAMPDRAKELRGMLKAWQARLNANMPKPNPEYTSGE